LAAVLGTLFEQQHTIVFKNDLAFDLAITGRADCESDVVKQIWASACSHYEVASLLPKMALKTAITRRRPPTSTARQPTTKPNPPTIMPSDWSCDGLFDVNPLIAPRQPKNAKAMPPSRISRP